MAGFLANCQPEPSPNPVPQNLLTSQNRDFLLGATQSYQKLRASMDPDEARQALVERMNQTDGIHACKVVEDGYTIVVYFSDGQLGAINTDEAFAGAAAYDPGPMQTAFAKSAPPKASLSDDESFNPSNTAKPASADLKHTPASRKVLLMSSAGLLFPHDEDRNMFEFIRDFLVEEHNWPPGDIDIKVGASTLTFEDFFRLEDYGVIVIAAHSLFRTANSDEFVVTAPIANGEDTDPFDFGFKVKRADARESLDDPLAGTRMYYYIQVAEYDSYFDIPSPRPDADPFDFGFRPKFSDAASLPNERFDLEKELRRGRIITVDAHDAQTDGAHSYLYMREDLWRENIDTLPNSLVIVISPHADAPSSDPFNFSFKPRNGALKDDDTSRIDVLFGKGYGSWLGWDQHVATQAAADTLWIIPYMARFSTSDVDEFSSGHIPTEAVSPGASGANPVPAHLNLYPYDAGSDMHLYLPTWAKIATVGAPQGTLTAEVEIEYTDPLVKLPEITEVEDLIGVPKELEDLIPDEEATFTARAFDADGLLLAETQKTLLLKAGGNEFTIAFGYATNFENGVEAFWSTDKTGVLQESTYLGPFHHDEVDLQLTGLPGHSGVAVDFDVITFGSWTGGGCTIYDFPWYTEDGTFMGEIDLHIGNSQFEVLYSRSGENNTCCIAYDNHDWANYFSECELDRDDPIQDGAIRVYGPQTAMYHVHAVFQHTGEGLTLRFWQDERFTETLEYYGLDIEPPTWGIDNVEVKTCFLRPGGECTVD